jgi:L-ornithine N5-monooxygenase
VTAALDHQEVELLAIGAGPANLAFAVAVEELAPPDLAANTLLIEQHENVAWQRGMLLPWTQSQVSFLKDLVTLRNPRSKFSFVNYLHTVGRLNDFVNMASFLPFRLEISDYLQWVAESLSKVRVEYGRRCQRIEARRAADGSVIGWLVYLADGSTIGANSLVIGIGREARIPAEFKELPYERVIHSTQYSLRTAELDPDAPLRIVVVGAAQSAAEMLWATHQRMPNAQCAMIVRSVGLEYYQTSKFTNELYFPTFTDEFYSAPPDARRHILRDMRQTNYAGVTPNMLDTLYRQMYLERLTGTQRLRMITMVDVTKARMDGDEVVLTLSNRMGRVAEELPCDLLLLGTGFEPTMPSIVRNVAEEAGVAEVAVSRAYRLLTPPNVSAACYLQGTNEDSHGIADSLMSVLAVRAAEIVDDVIAHRTEPTLLASVAASA